MNCLCAGVRKAARKLTSYYEKELRPANLTPAQFEVLQTVAAIPDITQTVLAEKLSLDQTTLSRNLKILIERKWLKRAVSSEDRRLAAYALSSAGQKTLDCAIPLWQRAQSHVQSNLNGDCPAVWSAIERLAAADYTSEHDPE